MYDDGDVKDTHPSYIPTAKRKPIIVCGDLNVAANPIDIKNPKANEKNAGYTIQEREAFQTLLDSGFVDTYRYLHPDKVEYSWWSYRFKARERNAGWRIDYFLMSEFAKSRIIDAKIHTEVMGSDHCPVSLEIQI
jgi:exodeoxyribonuclease-3